MKPHQLSILALTLLGAIAGSTMATMAHLQTKESAPQEQTRLNATTPPTTGEVEKRDRAANAVETAQRSRPSASEFSQFKIRLLDAIQRKDTNFIRAIATPQTQWSYGGSVNLDTYNIDNQQSRFWTYLEKAMNQGCVVDETAQVPEKEPGSSVWSCPDMTKVQQSITPERPNFGTLAVIGQNVNVRAEPGMGGRIIGTLSNDYVSLDSAGYNSLPPGVAEQMQADVLNGWTPVSLRNGQRGWILSRYVYDAENDYRVSFVRSRGQWRLHYFLRGNGN